MSASTAHSDMPYRLLGHTGERVSAIGLGGWHLGFESLTEAQSRQLDESLRRFGIDTIDLVQHHEIIRYEVLAKTAKAASRGEFELFKTTSIFDATATNPGWLGEEPQHVQQAMPD